MNRSTWIRLCLLGAIGCTGAAVVLRLLHAPPGTPAGSTFALLGPVFFVMAAQRATRFPRASVVLAGLGLLLAFGALAAVLSSHHA